MKRRRGGGGGGGRGRGDYNCNAVFRSNAAELYTHGQRDCFLLSIEHGRGDGEKCRGRGGGGRGEQGRGEQGRGEQGRGRSNAAELYLWTLAIVSFQ